MAFRYENYGNADLLLTSATTLTNLPASQAICGYAFWGSQRLTPNFNIPAGIKEIWIKLDLFCDTKAANGNRFSFGHYSSSLDGYVGVWNDSGNYKRFLIDAQPTTARNTNINTTLGSINSVLLHMVSASSGGIIELNVNGSTYTYTGNVNNGDDFDCIYFYSSNSNTLFSNIIVSDSEIALSDNVSACLFNVNFDAQRIIKHSVTIPTNRYSIYFADSSYATLPLDVLPNASVFTIEAKFSTTSIKSSNNNWQWGTIAGLEIGGNWKNDFGLCVNNGYLCFWAEPSTGGSSATNNTVSNAIVNDGLIHKVAVVSNADGSIDLFCDGVKVAHTDNVNAKISDEYNIRVAYDNDSNSYLPMDLYELRFWSTARNDIWADISGSEDNLEAWFLPTDNALLDFSGFDRHATISGNPAFNLLSSAVHFDTTFDAQRLVGNTVTIDFDAQRIISPPAVHFDTTFDAQRLVYRSAILDFDAQRIVKKSFTVDFDAERIITTAPTTLVHLSFDELEPDTGQEFSYYADPYYDETGRHWYNPSGFSLVTKANAKFGNALTMDGNGYLNHDGSFSLGSQDFTVDGWAFIDSDCADCSIATLEISYSNDYSLRFKDGKFVFSHSNEDLTADFAIVNHWFYFAISYQHSTGTITLFINGVDVAHFDAQIDYGDTFSVTFGDGLLGLLDELRVINGRALWYNTEHFDVNFDAEISFSNNHNFVTIDFDSCRNVHRTVNFLVDTCRNISHKFIMTPAKDGILYADAAESTGIQSLQIDISPQQITDQFSFTAVNDVDILQNVKGQYLDYLFDLRIEKITQKGILNTCLCCSDVDKILYTQLAYKVKGTTGGRYIITLENQVIVSEMPKASAHSHISRIANIIGKKLVYLADEFISSIDTEQGGVTYNDLIRDIFGWSSRVPTKLINCYIRNDTLCVIQRGYEQNTIDVSNARIANLTITKELYRTTWGSTPTSYTVTQTTGKYYGMEPILRPWPDEDTPPEPSTPSRVLPTYINHSENGKTTETYYDYDDDGNVTNIHTISPDTETVTYNSYKKKHGRKYLVSESTYTYARNGPLIDEKHIYHSYLEQGQENIIRIDGDGNIDGSITTPSRIDARPTPFEDNKNSEYYYNNDTSVPWNRSYTYVDGVKMEIIGCREVQYGGESKEITNYGIALYDSSFPIEDYNTLYALTAELRRLNRTTQETISLDIYDYPHVFDFNDKIIFGGNEYFLDGNSVSKTPRIVNKQSLKLVRWY